MIKPFVRDCYVFCVDVSHLSPMCPDSGWPLAPVLSEVEASGLWPLRLRRLRLRARHALQAEYSTARMQ